MHRFQLIKCMQIKLKQIKYLCLHFGHKYMPQHIRIFVSNITVTIEFFCAPTVKISCHCDVCDLKLSLSKILATMLADLKYTYAVHNTKLTNLDI